MQQEVAQLTTSLYQKTLEKHDVQSELEMAHKKIKLLTKLLERHTQFHNNQVHT